MRNKLHQLSAKQVNEVRQKQQATLAASRKRWRQRHQRRAQWGRNDYGDDDFVSRLLVKWTFSQLLEYSKLLVVLVNRNHSPHYKYHSEYYDTLFANYTHLWRDDRSLTFSAYYSEIYRQALDHGSHSEALKQLPHLTHYYAQMLRACFLVALTYDARVRRFVFARHDIHYDYLKSHPPSVTKTSQFIREIQLLVDQFITAGVSGESLSTQATDLWLSDYMFRLD